MDADDLTAHRTRTNRREEHHALGVRNPAAASASGTEQEVARAGAADRSQPRATPQAEALTPHPATVAEIDQAMADVIEDRD